jgi:hypothetical protein
VYTQFVEVILGVPFGYEPNEEVRKLLEDFRDMVNFCIDHAYRRRITSYATLRKRRLRGVEAQVGLLDALLPLSLQDSAGDAQDLQEEARGGQA